MDQPLTVDWLIVEQKPGRRVPAWMRTVAVDPTGDIWVPAVASGRGEMEVSLCAGHDGTLAILNGEHAYYPIGWIEREFLDAHDVCALIRRKVAEARAMDTGG